MPTQSTEFGLSVDEFAIALRDAVHDVKHEQTPGQGLRHFWDFSCLYPLLSPDNLRSEYTNFPSLGNQEQRRELLTLALFSAGMTGSVSLLPPHLVEFHKDVEREIRQGGPFQEQLARSWLITSLKELDRFYDQLKRAVQADLAEVVAEFDLEQAIAAQLLAVPSTARRVRLWLDRRQVDIRPPKLKPEFDPSGGIFAEVLAALTRERPGPEKRDANLADSVAIQMLAHLNGLTEYPYPRFFSSSRAVNRVLRRKVIADNFTYTCRDALGYEFTSSIIRDTNYYYVRSIFAPLNWRSADGQDIPTQSLAGLDELADLSANLNQALSISQPGIVGTIPFQGRPIGELLAQMRIAGSKASLINVPSDRLAEQLIGLDAEEAAISEAGRAQLTSKLRHELGELASRASRDAAKAAATVSACTQISERLIVLTPPKSGIAGAVRFVREELFAYRWAYREIEARYAEALHSIALQPSAAGASNSAASIISYGTPAYIRKPGPQRWQWLATLYSVELFRLVIEAAPSSTGSSDGDVVSSLIVLAARCRVSEEQRDSVALDTHREDLRGLWRACSSDERDELLLGFGTAFLHSRLNWQAALGSGYNLFNWSECQEIGEYAVSRSQMFADSDAYPFVVNFICVLDLYGQVADADAKRFWSLLAGFSAVPSGDNYRMMDTLSLKMFVDARKALDQDPDDVEALELLGSARNELRRLLRRRHSRFVSDHYQVVNAIYHLQKGSARHA